MKRQYHPKFIKALKKANVRIQKSFRERIEVFSRNPNAPQLNNHLLQKQYKGFRSIDITNDYRAIYEEIHEGDDTVAYFSLLGTHEELYSSNE